MTGADFDPASVKLGRQAHDPVVVGKHFKLASVVDDDAIPEAPADVGCGRYMTSTPLLGNEVAGNCVVVTLMHLVQAVTARMGRERTFTREEALRTYGILGGWPAVDEGLNMYYALTRWKEDPSLFGDVEIEGFASVDMTDWERVQQGLWLFGGVATGFDMPRLWQRETRLWQLDMSAGDDAIEAGKWGGHAMFGGDRVFVPGGRPRLVTRTWGGDREITARASDAYGAECYAVLLKGWEPPDVPGFDRDRLLRALRQVSA